MAEFITEDTYTPEKLVNGDFPLRTVDAILASGENRQAGALLGKVTADGKVKLSASAAGDGSEAPYAILAEDKDASGGDESVTIYLTGDFNENAITYGTGHSADSVRDELRKLSIFTSASITA